MSENENKVVSLTIDAKYGKIRIHKNTLSFLGRPEYISLIINPEDHTLGVKGSKVGIVDLGLLGSTVVLVLTTNRGGKDKNYKQCASQGTSVSGK